MREALPGTPDEKSYKAALNGSANPSGQLVQDGQLFLGSEDARCREGAVAMGLAVKEAQRESGFTLTTVGSLIGKDATAPFRVFNPEDPSIALQALAAVFLLDTNGIVLRRMAQLTGREVVDRPRLTKEQKYDLLVEHLRRHGKIGEAVISEALGERTP